jgi:tetratricopeptide (TPR) repeat protein
MSEKLHRASIVLLATICLSSATWRLLNPPVHPSYEDWVSNGWDDIANGQFYKARTNFIKIVAMNRDNEIARSWLALLEQRYTYYGDPKSLKLMQKNIQAMIKVSSNDPYKYMVAGEIEFRLKMFREARHYLRLANDINSQIPHVWYLLGAIHLKMNEKDEAIAALRRARMLRTEPAINDLVLAQIMWQSGNLEEAHKIYSEVADKYRRNSLFRLEIVRILLHWQRFTEAKVLLDSGDNWGSRSRLFQNTYRQKQWTLFGLDLDQEISREDIRTYTEKLQFLVDTLVSRKVLPMNFYEQMGGSEVTRLLLEKDIDMIRKWSTSNDIYFQNPVRLPTKN